MSDDAHRQPGLACWSCGVALAPRDVVRHGIIRSRSPEEGGPYRWLACPDCHAPNLCERTSRGRWFASPPVQPSLVEWLLGRVFGSAEEILRAAAWHQDNAERRRYFFERDGDDRYSPGGLLGRLLRRDAGPERGAGTGAATGETARGPGTKASSASARDRGAGGGRRAGGPGGAGRGGSTGGPRSRPGGPRTPSPWEILGVRRGASEAEVRAAFHRLALQYHPDKVHHLGEDFQRAASRRFLELQRAYEAIARRSGGEGG